MHQVMVVVVMVLNINNNHSKVMVVEKKLGRDVEVVPPVLIFDER